MVTKAMIEDFLSQHSLAIVGVSRKGTKFGNNAFRELIEKGYELTIIHPSGEVIEGQQSYPNMKDLPVKVGGVLVIVPPDQAKKVVEEAHAAGIKRVWLQPGAESPASIQYGEQVGISVIHDECILMHAKPQKFFHKPHRWVMGLMGRLPK